MSWRVEVFPKESQPVFSKHAFKFFQSFGHQSKDFESHRQWDGIPLGSPIRVSRWHVPRKEPAMGKRELPSQVHASANNLTATKNIRLKGNEVGQYLLCSDMCGSAYRFLITFARFTVVCHFESFQPGRRLGAIPACAVLRPRDESVLGKDLSGKFASRGSTGD